MRWRFVLAALLLAAPAAAQTQSIVDFEGRPGVPLKMLRVEPDGPPRAAVLLFSGGNGSIRLASPTATPLAERYARGNFLLRIRASLAARGLRVGALDVPQEMAQRGMSAAFRRSAEHARDIAGAVALLRGPEKLPVWLVGTSMGTVSAAAAAVTLGRGIDGVVLTSSITVPIQNGPNWIPEPGGIRAFALDGVSVPVFVLAHEDDECWASPPGNAKALAERFKASPRVGLRILEGGKPPESGECDPLSGHGYWGIDTTASDAIADFVLGQR
ncbi:MAG: alpha/beta hydrolase [Alphaproteobacteria bacterium]|nr:alpha/beta hydrolase [Alphaproteobacteria bacterium]